jgi:cytochrome c oxidase cbb3-type subunit 3
MKRFTPVLAALTCACALLACQREARRFRERPALEAPLSAPAALSLHPGENARTGEHRPPLDLTTVPEQRDYPHNAWALNQGKRLYTWFNCTGCHANGGGGIGPALMDAHWIYGDDVASIARSIVEGRPNGMPSFRDKLSAAQALQLAAYVRSMAGLVPMSAAPGRNDSMSYKNPEMMTPAQLAADARRR